MPPSRCPKIEQAMSKVRCLLGYNVGNTATPCDENLQCSTTKHQCTGLSTEGTYLGCALYQVCEIHRATGVIPLTSQTTQHLAALALKGTTYRERDREVRGFYCANVVSLPLHKPDYRVSKLLLALTHWTSCATRKSPTGLSLEWKTLEGVRPQSEYLRNASQEVSYRVVVQSLPGEPFYLL